MKVSNGYVVVERFEDVKQEGFQTVEVQDNFIYKGKVTLTPEQPVFIGNSHIAPGDVILFAKYSPDTHDITDDGKKLKFVSTRDILAVL
jgi:co-chaperonin GroES (HSP10)